MAAKITADSSYPDYVAASFVGAFITPLLMGYANKRNQPRLINKAKIRSVQKDADKLMASAAALAKDLATKLEEIQNLSKYHPEELNALSLISKKIDLKGHEFNERDRAVETFALIEVLANSLYDHPCTNDLFGGVPGMKSQKTTWRDWIREAVENVKETEDIYELDSFEIREIDWVHIVNILCDSSISRGSVQSALKD